MEINVVPLADHQIKPIPNDLTFGKNFTNRMFIQQYNPNDSWHNARIKAYEPFTLDPSSLVFHYGQEIFEGTKAYRRPDGNINLFRPWENAKRFNNSAERMSMVGVDVEDHVNAITRLVDMEHAWVPDQPGSSLYIRPVLIASETTVGLRASSEYIHYIITCPVGNYYAKGMKPVSVFVSDEYRRATKGGTGAAKTGGNYAASLLVAEKVKKMGYDQVLWLDGAEGLYVEEVGSMNIWFVYGDNKLVTPALNGSILPGITRDSLLTLAPDLGYEVAEEQLAIEQILADIESGAITESFGCGTAVVISSVNRYGYRGQDYLLKNQDVGPVARKLYAALTDIQYGRTADPYGWTHTIMVDGR